MMEAIEPSKRMTGFAVSMRLFGAFTLGLFAVGIVVGAVSVSLRENRFMTGTAIGVGLALVLGAIAGWLVYSTRGHFKLPRSPRVRRSRVALYAALGASAGLGIAVGIVGDAHDDGGNIKLLFTASPISAALAIGTIAG